MVSPRGEYKKLKTVGRGKFGKVCQAVDLETGQISAIKIMKNSDPSSRNESRIIGKMDHPNIIKKLDDWNEGEVYYLSMEYADLGNLKEYIISKNKIQECEARDIFKQIVDGLKYAHQQLICHRDLKLENIVIFEDEGSPSGRKMSIIDWGLSTSFSYLSLRSSFCGTLPYLSPEMLSKEQYIGPEVDIWSLGVILYFILTKHYPFKGKDVNSIKYEIYSGHSPILPAWSSELKDLLSRLLAVDTDDRIRTRDISDHPWIKENFGDNNIQQIPVELLEGWKRIYQDGEFFLDSESSKSIQSEIKDRNSRDIIIRNV